MSKNNIRKVSYDILSDVFYNKKLLNNLIDEKFDNLALSAEDKSFIKRECSGVIENLDFIDEKINKFSKIKTKKLDKEVLIALRIGIYEIFFCDKVPEFATINESVNLVKMSKKEKLSGYVNAVLRKVANDKNDNNNIDSKNANITTKRCYFKIYNDKEKDVINELNLKNINYKKYDGALDFIYSKVYYLDNYKDIIELDNFKDGNILIMDASSIYLTDKLAYYIKEREKDIKVGSKNDQISMIKLLDTCASPGGKILSLIDLIYNDYVYFYAEARDISEEKILKICENVNRLKIIDLNLLVKDATIHDDIDDDKYDVMILDVPCTGLGVIDKKPDIKLNYSDKKRDSLVKIQRDILSATKNYVKKGGIISYSTCTETKEENEDNIDDFLKKNLDFEKIFEKRIFRGDENKSDGFYMCFLKRI